jgi:hypothetical protein
VEDEDQEIDPVKAKVNILIKEKLDKKRKHKEYDRRRKRNILNMIEYYEYNGNDEQERDANEQEMRIKDDKISNNNNEILKHGEYRCID